MVRKKTLFSLAWPERNAETDRELIHDITQGFTNGAVTRAVLWSAPYATVEALLARATHAVAAERQLVALEMSKEKDGLSPSGAIQQNLQDYAERTGVNTGPEPMDCSALGAVTEANDDDILQEEAEYVMNAIGTFFQGTCYKCGEFGHTIARCTKPVGWRRSGYRGGRGLRRGGRSWRGGRGRGAQRDQWGRFRPSQTNSWEEQEEQQEELQGENADLVEDPGDFPQ